MKIERFTGINNRQPVDRIQPTDAGIPVRDAVNVDLSASGTFQRRPGYEQVVTMANCRDLREVKGGALFASGDRLCRFNGATTTEVAALASPFVRVAYADSPLGTIWSDGFTLNVYSGTSKKLTPAVPNPAPVASASVLGSLAAGTYGVFFASIRSDGQQSAPTFPQYIAVPANGSIQVSASGHTERIAVFITAVDGEMFYREGSIEVGQTSAAFPVLSGAGQPVRYEPISDLPPGRILAVDSGRLLSADGPYLFYSLPWNMGLYRPAKDFIPFPEDITLIAPSEGGVYLCTTSKTYWLPGGDISKADMDGIAPYGAIKGTLSEMPNSLDLMWFSPRGPVRASPGGQIALMQDQQIAYGKADAGTSVVRESSGLRQFITSLSQAQPSGGAVFGSYMDARVITGA